MLLLLLLLAQASKRARDQRYSIMVSRTTLLACLAQARDKGLVACAPGGVPVRALSHTHTHTHLAAKTMQNLLCA